MKRLVALLILVIPIAFSQTRWDSLVEEARERGEIVLNFEGVNIKELARFMGEITGKNVLVDPAVSGKMSLVFSKPLDVKEAWDVFTSALAMQGLGVVEDGEVVRIMPVNEAVSVAKIKRKPSKGELSVLVFNLKYAEAQTVMNSVRPFLSPFARVNFHGPSNTLIVADLGENIEKLKSILRNLDSREAQGSIRVYRLRYLSAQEAVRLITPLNAVFAKRFGTSLIVSSSKEANAVVVFTTLEGHRLIERVISELDVEGVLPKQRSFYIIPLEFISAEELSETFRTLFGGGRSPATAPRRAEQRYTKPRQRVQGKAGQPRPVQKQSRPSNSASRALEFISVGKDMKIGFDRGTNSVILYATREEYESIKKLISELDVRRKQVLIATTVVEASTKSLLDIGVRWQILGNRGGASFRGSSLTDIYSSFLSGSFLIGVFSDSGRTINVGGAEFFFPDLVLLFSLLESGSGFNIVSNPRVLTLDNQPAVIKVGQVIPYAEGVKFDINGQPIITYDYKEVGLELNVTPRISGDNLRLTINLNLEEIIDFVTNQIGATSYTVPVTSNREVNSDVVVENGQTVILGGLVSTKTLKTIEGVPGLWRLPIMGRLFRRDVRQEDKTTLFIFITPYIISSPEELAKITQEHRRLAEEIKRMLEERQKSQEEEFEEDEEDFY